MAKYKVSGAVGGKYVGTSCTQCGKYVQENYYLIKEIVFGTEQGIGAGGFCSAACANAYINENLVSSSSKSDNSSNNTSSDDYEEQESESVQLERAKGLQAREAARNKARLEEKASDYKLLQSLKFDGNSTEIQNEISNAWSIFEKGYNTKTTFSPKDVKSCCKNDNSKIAFEKVQFGIMRLHSAGDNAGAKY